jgi:hypothetical protein
VLVALLGVDGAVIASGALLAVVALAIAPRLAGTVAGARVPERAFALIRSLPVFAPLPIAMLKTLALRLRERRYAAGDRIVTQGEVGEAFYVIAEGTVAVTVDEAPRRELGAGDFFGEIALLHDLPRRHGHRSRRGRHARRRPRAVPRLDRRARAQHGRRGGRRELPHGGRCTRARLRPDPLHFSPPPE